VVACTKGLIASSSGSGTEPRKSSTAAGTSAASPPIRSRSSAQNATTATIAVAIMAIRSGRCSAPKRSSEAVNSSRVTAMMWSLWGSSRVPGE
jgi:hypothetical protein